MDSKAKCELSVAPEPSALKLIPTVPKNRVQMILISVLLVLLAIIIVEAIIIGVYMTQKHTEKVIKTIHNGSDGGVVEQTMMVNNLESVAAFHIQKNMTSATIVYDYKHSLLGFRIQDKSQCSVVAMDSVNVPSLNEITKRIEHFGEEVSKDVSLAYSFKQGELADRTVLGTTMNILCSDVPVYWAEQKQQQGSVTCLGILIHEICFMF